MEYRLSVELEGHFDVVRSWRRIMVSFSAAFPRSCPFRLRNSLTVNAFSCNMLGETR